MIDKFDYLEPKCPLSGGKEFYYPERDAPLGSIPVDRIISKLDSLFDKNDYAQAAKLLNYWLSEAKALRDKRGELSVLNELVGFYRKINDKEKGIAVIEHALMLIDELKLSSTVSSATILLNCATAYKAFGELQKSLELFLRTEEIYNEKLDNQDKKVAALYNNMALTLADLGEYTAAEEKYLKAIEIMKAISGGELECAITYLNILHMKEDIIAAEETEKYLQIVYNLLKSESLTRNGYYAFVLEKCALSFKYFEKENIYNELIAEAKKIYKGASNS